jgi:hypothetical protein
MFIKYKNIIDNNKTHISLIPSKYDNINKNCNIIFIIDISGSMDIIASQKNSNGECDDLSRLNLACHSITTIIESLSDNDEIGIISFNHIANINLQMTKMNENGKTIAKMVINSLQASGTTNIYDGLKRSFELLTTITNNNNNSIVLLTDGESNADPPNGILQTLQNRFDLAKMKPFSLNTFGFGYDINSILLNDIATNYNGIFGFIPDCSMVGTVFINFIANLLTTYLTNIKMMIIFNDNTTKIINTGTILYESTRDFIIDYNNNDIKTIELYYENKLIEYADISNNYNDKLFKANEIRTKIVETIRTCITNCNQREIVNLYNDIMNDDNNDNNEITNYLKDYINDGQIKQAYIYDNYKKWGKHYLLSLMCGYDNQLCINFKDYGVQHFATDIFKDIRDKIELIFCNISPPQPKNIRRTTTRISSMENYYRNDSGCFDGNGMVAMADNTFKLVKDLKKGDIIYSMTDDELLFNYMNKELTINTNNKTCKIVCIIKQNINTQMDVCLANGILVTPYHPIYMHNRWLFPNSILPVKTAFIDTIYNIVVDNYHNIIINYVPVITLGHNLNANNITKHDYFGSTKVIDDLKNYDGFENGLIECNKMETIRDEETTQIIKIIINME